MTFTQLLRALAARRKLFRNTVLWVVAVVMALSLILPKRYVAEASVVIAARETDPVSGNVLPPTLTSAPANLDTQVSVIDSRNVALQVVDALNLTADSELSAKYRHSSHGDEPGRDWIADQLLKEVDVTPKRTGNVIDIDFPYFDPVMAARIANGFADAYMRTNLELQLNPARREADWFKGRLHGLRQALQESQGKLSAYEEQNHIVVAPDVKLDAETLRLTDLETALVTAQADMYSAQTRLRQMNQAVADHRLEELPDILGNVLLQNLRVDLERAQGLFAQAAQRFDNNHPEYQAAAAQVQAVRARLDAEIQNAKGSIVQAAQISAQRAAEQQRAIDEQKVRILDLKRQNDQIALLSGEVTDAQRAFDAASQRTNDVGLQSQVNQATVTQLDVAIAPAKPKFPRLRLNMALSLVLGALLGTSLVLFAELRDRLVRSSADLGAIPGLAVLAELPPPARPRRRFWPQWRPRWPRLGTPPAAQQT